MGWVPPRCRLDQASVRAKSSDCVLRGPLFTNYRFENIGTQRNEENPFFAMPPEINPLGEDFIDLGLGGFLAMRLDFERFAPENVGKQKIPTLRNVDKRPSPDFIKAFAHNGYFKSLEEVVHFLNTRDVLPTCEPNDPGEKITCWPPPEAATNLNTQDVGDLGLTDVDEASIVAFLKTLSDGFEP